MIRLDWSVQQNSLAVLWNWSDLPISSSYSPSMYGIGVSVFQEDELEKSSFGSLALQRVTRSDSWVRSRLLFILRVWRTTKQSKPVNLSLCSGFPRNKWTEKWKRNARKIFFRAEFALKKKFRVVSGVLAKTDLMVLQFGFFLVGYGDDALFLRNILSTLLSLLCRLFLVLSVSFCSAAGILPKNCTSLVCEEVFRLNWLLRILASVLRTRFDKYLFKLGNTCRHPKLTGTMGDFGKAKEYFLVKCTKCSIVENSQSNQRPL